MITDFTALNYLKSHNCYCKYCKRYISNTSPMQLDVKKRGDKYTFYHTKCFLSTESLKNKLVSNKTSHKSSHAQIRDRMTHERRHG